MLLSSGLRYHVGEASTYSKPAIVGEGTAQGRAIRTGDGTGLTG
jgi:hypothetical protein